MVLAADVVAESVAQFVEDNAELKKLNMKVDKSNESIVKVLREEFRDTWTQSTIEINFEKNE